MGIGMQLGTQILNVYNRGKGTELLMPMAKARPRAKGAEPVISTCCQWGRGVDLLT